MMDSLMSHLYHKKDQSNINEDTVCPGGNIIGLLEALGFGPEGTDTMHDGPEVHPHILDLKGAGSDCAADPINAY